MISRYEETHGVMSRVYHSLANHDMILHDGVLCLSLLYSRSLSCHGCFVLDTDRP